MVFFTCNSCGQSIKKVHVEKHYLTECRNCEVLSCMDCGKDFVGDDYKHHTKCVSENEKYGGKDYRATVKPNKGEVKQSQWIECVQAAGSSQSVSPRVRQLLNRLADYNNIPRKKAKFERFIQNSLKVWDASLIEQIWTVFSQASNKEKAQPEQKTTEDNAEEQAKITEEKSPKNGGCSTGDQSEQLSKGEVKKKKLTEAKDGGTDEGKVERGTAEEEGCDSKDAGQGDSELPKKKRKKKSVSCQDSNNGVIEEGTQEGGTVDKEGCDNNIAGQGDGEHCELPKKKKKRKRVNCQDDDGTQEGGSIGDEELANKEAEQRESDLPKKKKKRRREKEQFKDDSEEDLNCKVTRSTVVCSYDEVEWDEAALPKEEKKKTPKKYQAEETEGLEGGLEGDECSKKGKKKKHSRSNKESKGERLLDGDGDKGNAVDQMHRDVKQRKRKKSGGTLATSDEMGGSDTCMDGLLSSTEKKRKKTNRNKGLKDGSNQTLKCADGLLCMSNVKTTKKTKREDENAGEGNNSVNVVKSKLKNTSKNEKSVLKNESSGGQKESKVASNADGPLPSPIKKVKRKLEGESFDEVTLTKKKKKSKLGRMESETKEKNEGKKYKKKKKIREDKV